MILYEKNIITKILIKYKIRNQQIRNSLIGEIKMIYVIALALAVILNASANLLMKFGVQAINKSSGMLPAGNPIGVLKALLGSPLILAGLFCFATNVILYSYALQKFKVSLAYPIMVGAGFGIIAIVARFSGLNEKLLPSQWIGVALIFAGVILISITVQNG